MNTQPVTNAVPEPQQTGAKNGQTADQTTPSSALVGLNEASRLTGRGKETILKYAADGKLSVVLNGQGKKVYQVVDLERVFGFKTTPTSKAPSNQNHNQPDGKSQPTAVEVAQLQGQIATLQATLEAEREKARLLVEVADDAKQNAENWRQQAERATLILTDQRAQPEPQPEPKRGFLAALFGGRSR